MLACKIFENMEFVVNGLKYANTEAFKVLKSRNSK